MSNVTNPIICHWTIRVGTCWLLLIQPMKNITMVSAGIVPPFPYSQRTVQWLRLSALALVLHPSFALRAQLTYTTNDNAITITGFTGIAGDLTIPESIGRLPVRVIGVEAFNKRDDLVSVVIPNTVRDIQDFAFDNCTNLVQVTLGSGVTNIGVAAFSVSWSLKSITFHEGLVRIGPGAFSFSSVTNVVVPNSVTSLGDGAFSDSGVLSATIGNGVTQIGNGLFSYAFGLGTVTIGSSVTNIGDSAFSQCYSLSDIVIPDSVTRIEANAFQECTGLISMVIGRGLTSIGNGVINAFPNLANITVDAANPAFGSMGGVLFNKAKTELILYPATRPYDSYSIPDSVTSIRSNAFLFNYRLTNLFIGNHVTNIGERAFALCTGISSVAIPDSVSVIGNDSFDQCTGMTNLTFGHGATIIGSSAFALCTGLTRVDIGNGVTSIGDAAFYQCSGLTNVTIPDSVTRIGHHAFDLCRLDGVTIGNGVIDIGVGAFRGCPLTYVNLGKNLGIIEDQAFYFCFPLTRVSIPGSVTNIGWSVFDGCFNLRTVVFEGNIPLKASSLVGNSTPSVYHLPGTSGWGTSYALHPIRLWNPQASPLDPGFGVKNGAFGLNITGTPDITVIVEASPNPGIGPWVPVSTNTLADGSSLFTEPAGLATGGRFYRFHTP